jgi:hypothetical protein
MRNIEELVDTLSRDASLVKPTPHPFILSTKWMGGVAIYLALSLIISGLRPDLMVKLHEPWFAVEIAVLIAIFIGTSLSAAVLSFPDLHQMRRIAFAPAFLFALFLLIIILAWRTESPATPLPMHTYECTLCIILVSLLPAAWTFFEIRKFASTHFRLTGSIALLFAFSIGALWLRLYESNDSIVHVIQWHYLPMIGFGVVGMWLGKVILKW